MDLGNLGDKAKQAATEHRDQINEHTDKAIDSRLEGDQADKARQARDKGLDALGEQ